jgi:hypothetical protein
MNTYHTTDMGLYDDFSHFFPIVLSAGSLRNAVTTKDVSAI